MIGKEVQNLSLSNIALCIGFHDARKLSIWMLISDLIALCISLGKASVCIYLYAFKAVEWVVNL